VALSSTEAEYMALCNASKEAIYLKNLITEINFGDKAKTPIMIHCDNLSAIQLVKNPVYHSRSKHIDIKVHFVREIYQQHIIEVTYVSTNEIIADILTKVLAKQKHLKFVEMLGIQFER
jgi:hypothetical protein